MTEGMDGGIGVYDCGDGWGGLGDTCQEWLTVSLLYCSARMLTLTLLYFLETENG